MAAHPFAQPQDFSLAISHIEPSSWPPSDADLNFIGLYCREIIENVYNWETEHPAEGMTDSAAGHVSTAEVFRILAREIAVSDEGEIAVLLVPGGELRVQVELRAEVDEPHGILRRPEMALTWFVDGELMERFITLKRKGPHWYMLSQLRDDLWEDRLGE